MGGRHYCFCVKMDGGISIFYYMKLLLSYSLALPLHYLLPSLSSPIFTFYFSLLYLPKLHPPAKPALRVPSLWGDPSCICSCHPTGMLSTLGTALVSCRVTHLQRHLFCTSLHFLARGVLVYTQTLPLVGYTLQWQGDILALFHSSILPTPDVIALGLKDPTVLSVPWCKCTVVIASVQH